MRSSSLLRPILLVVGIAWALAVAAGLSLLWIHETAPGDSGDPGRRWPVGGVIVPDPGRANLVMLAHSRCPCTRASLGELSRIMARCQGRATARVLFYRPARSPASWGLADLWREAAAIPGVRPIDDAGGAEAARFGAATSGHVFLFAPDGRLIFSGGITGARGHAGDNDGEDAVVSLVNGSRAGRSRAAVFGCPIVDAQ